MTQDSTIREAAIGWAVRTGDPAFDGWEDFTQWLEASPAHAAAYDAVMADVSDMADLLPAPLPAANPAANDDDALPWYRRRWIGGGLAAALAVVALLGVQQWRGADRVVETAPGQVEVVTLDGGDTITVAGDSRLVIDGDNPRMASLDRGRALFTLRAPGQPAFTLTVGPDRLTDIGTVFDVSRSAGGMSVAVAEGAVLFDPAGRKLRVSPGHKLTREGQNAPRLTLIAAEQVGEWADGRLTFEDASLAEVAAELTRATGRTFTAQGADASLVSGSILLDPVRADPRSIGPLLGVTVRRDGAGWVIGAR